MEDLTINGEGAELFVSSPYARVIRFEDCSLVTLRGLRLGHRTTEPCMAGVLSLEGCADFLLEECGLYGSGAVGLELFNSSGLTMQSGSISGCTNGAAWVRDSWVISFNGVAVETNEGGYPLIGVYGSDSVLFHDCRFHGNTGSEFLSLDPETGSFGFEYCEFTENTFDSLTDSEAYPCFYEIYYEGNSFDADLDALAEYGYDAAPDFVYHAIEAAGLAIWYPDWLILEGGDGEKPVLHEGEAGLQGIRVARVYTLAASENPDTQAERIFRKTAPLAEKWLAQLGFRVTRMLEEEPINTEAPPYHFDYYAEATVPAGTVYLRIKLVHQARAIWGFVAYGPDKDLLAPGSLYGMILDDIEAAGGD